MRWVSWCRGAGFGVVALVVSSLVTGCGDSGAPEDAGGSRESASRSALAQVNNAELRESDLQRMIPDDMRDVITGVEINDILTRWVDTELLHQKARRDALDRDPQVAEQLYEMERQLLADEYLQRQMRVRVRVTPEEIRAYYDDNLHLYTEELHLQHILLDTIEEAEAVLEEVKAGVGFNTLAKRQSIDASASKGGDIGYLGKGAMNPALEAEVFDMENLEVRGPIESGFGFHVVRVVGRRKLTRPIDFDAARDEIMQKILLQKQQNAYDALLAELRAGADVHIVDSYAGMPLRREDASPRVPESILPDSTTAP